MWGRDGRNRQSEYKARGEVQEGHYLHSCQSLDYQQMSSFSLSPYLSISFFLCGAFLPLTVKEVYYAQNLFKSGVCICKIATNIRIPFNVSINSLIIIPLFIF